ncbi:hypothetical protein K490DRAFT_65389 [Saccharata proteae CBS 121410]|uniref:Uncharacterized protein n=1 Tax=Saccharata proteae CBS 121410 TaxID=1314787 RepID=A0A9P4HWZ3_9PEZI|nr:hypothetical protein K490DRAFT_65389 [Saccharata proteae CBS 121410]
MNPTDPPPSNRLGAILWRAASRSALAQGLCTQADFTSEDNLAATSAPTLYTEVMQTTASVAPQTFTATNHTAATWRARLHLYSTATWRKSRATPSWHLHISLPVSPARSARVPDTPCVSPPPKPTKADDRNKTARPPSPSSTASVSTPSSTPALPPPSSSLAAAPSTRKQAELPARLRGDGNGSYEEPSAPPELKLKLKMRVSGGSGMGRWDGATMARMMTRWLGIGRALCGR